LHAWRILWVLLKGGGNMKFFEKIRVAAGEIFSFPTDMADAIHNESARQTELRLPGGLENIHFHVVDGEVNAKGDKAEPTDIVPIS
jgi:hypothetical protein